MSAAVATRRARVAVSRSPEPRRAAPARSASAGVTLPIAPAIARRVLAWGVALVLAALLVAALIAMRVPERVVAWAEAQSVRAGFEIADVRVTGTTHLAPDRVKAAALADGSSAMLALSPEAVRARVRSLPWVRDAVVARRLPDRVDITIIERAPAALWQLGGRTILIDATGHALPTRNLAPYAKLPLVAGVGAGEQYPSLIALLATQPVLAPKVDAATWVGGRRWDLTLKSRETISLPEGNDRAQAALAEFVALNARQPLIGGTFARFDLRLPGKMVVRLAHPVVDPKAKKGTAI